MEVAVEMPVPIDRQPEPSDTAPAEAPEQFASSRHDIAPPSSLEASSPFTESGPPDRPTEREVLSDAPAFDQTPSNLAQSTDTDAMDTTSDTPEQSNANQNIDPVPELNAMDIDSRVESTPNAHAPQTITQGADNRGADPADSASADTSSDNSTQPTSESSDSTSDEDNEEAKPEEPAYWADIEEDNSAPDEAELKEIESADADYSAFEYDYWEKTFYQDPDDPDYRPSEKARLTWKIKGVRGTKENPNRATIMRSPAAYVGGHYWTIKFFPRGNSVSSLSIYVECSATPPEAEKEIPETEFTVLKGAPDADLSKLTPDLELKLPATSNDKDTQSKPTPSSNGSQKNESNVETVEVSGRSTPAEPKPKEKNIWRVSAQIGVILYNPNEPRTGWMQSSCHQFNPHNVDWGWTHFHGPWDQIHKRHHGQRQALLRNDTLAFDAYIRIFDDPTQSLWWHASDSEPVWDSLTLTGYRPLGDPMVNYSHEVAGLATWLLMAPFREVIRSVDILEHLTNPNLKPRPLCDALQRLLWAMRNQSASTQLFIDTEQVTTTLRNLREFSGDVTEFWERLRRTLELELAGTDALDKLSKIFDSPRSSDPRDIDVSVPINYIPREASGRIRVPVTGANSIQEATKKFLDEKSGKWSLPSVFHVELARQTFDKATRQWNMLYDRVKLDEQLDLSDSVVGGQTGKYSLYGLIVHKGNRSSGRFYSILRPGGPNSRWLAFEDASDNKIACLTKKAALESHEGVEVIESKKVDKSGMDIAVVVVYVRDDVVSQYLTGKIEEWDAPELRKHYFKTGYYHLNRDLKNGLAPTVKVELFSLSDFSIIDKSIVDSYDIMAAARRTGQHYTLSVPGNTTFTELRKKIAVWKSTDDVELNPERIRLWQLGARKPLFAPTLNFQIIDDYADVIMGFELSVLRLWVHVLSDQDAKLFALPDPASTKKPFDGPLSETPETSNDELGTARENLAESQDSTAPAETDDAEMNDAPPEAHEAPVSGTADQSIELLADHEEVTTSESAEINESAPAEQSGNSTPTDTPMQDAGVPAEPNVNAASNDTAMDDDAAIAAVIAQDLDDFDRTEVMDAEPSPPADTDNSQPATTEETQVEPVSTQDQDPGNVSSEEVPGEATAENNNTQPTPLVNEDDALMEDSPAAETSESRENNAETQQSNIEQPTADSGTPTSGLGLIPLQSHVYYFIQKFDAQKQELSTVGTFFAKKEDVVKESVRAALGFEEDKPFLLWHRVDGISIIAVSSTEVFDNVVGYTDGECFVVGEVIGRNERMKLAETGLFSSPDRLVPYLWAVSRKHPTKSYTGTKTTEATYNGDYYTGEFKNGYYHGKGTHISESGATYIGDFVLGERQGSGIMEYASGDIYTGGWVEDQRHGQGTFVERKTGNKYVGGYRNGKRHGKGISYWEVADEEMDLCQICYSENQDSLFYSCGHVCACLNCARQVDICPMCRKKVLNVVKIYKS